MVNEYRNSINLGRIKVSRNDLKLTDGTYKFSIRDFKGFPICHIDKFRIVPIHNNARVLFP